VSRTSAARALRGGCARPCTISNLDEFTVAYLATASGACEQTANERLGTLQCACAVGRRWIKSKPQARVLYRIPEHISIMNYAFQLSWLVRMDGTRSLDFCRFGLAMYETALNEARGFAQSVGSPPARFFTAGFYPDGTQAVWFLVQSPVDFNCDGTITDPAPCPPTRTAMVTGSSSSRTCRAAGPAPPPGHCSRHGCRGCGSARPPWVPPVAARR
jgi:hypothetical protein